MNGLAELPALYDIGRSDELIMKLLVRGFFESQDES